MGLLLFSPPLCDISSLTLTPLSHRTFLSSMLRWNTRSSARIQTRGWIEEARSTEFLLVNTRRPSASNGIPPPPTHTPPQPPVLPRRPSNPSLFCGFQFPNLAAIPPFAERMRKLLLSLSVQKDTWLQIYLLIKVYQFISYCPSVAIIWAAWLFGLVYSRRLDSVNRPGNESLGGWGRGRTRGGKRSGVSMQSTTRVFNEGCCCSVAKSRPTLSNPMNCSMPGLPAPHHLLEFAQVHVHWIGVNDQSEHVSYLVVSDLQPNEL